MIDENGIILFKTFNRIATKYEISRREIFSICNALQCWTFLGNVPAIRVNQATNLFCWGQPQVLLQFAHHTCHVIQQKCLQRIKSFHFNLDALASQTIYLNLHKCFICQIPRDWNFTCQRHPFVENWEIQIKPISKPMNRESRVLCIDAVILYVNLCPAIFWC